ncbi:hypothetical protein EDB89DRAFT_1979612 [Lactarius sanguifluus]|nr:hypothetical protein EDB89DRAFT_1979612 [Lactarius sanguifluus]
MEENDERKDRDVRAIQWLIDSRTEDDEMESFLMAIPGAFTSKWGIDIWRKACEVKQLEGTNVRQNDLTVRLRSDADLRMPVLPHRRSPRFQRICHPLHFFHPLGRIIGIRIANGTPPEVTATWSMPRLPIDGQAHDNLYAHRDIAVYDLCKRVRHLVGTCNNHSIFANQELWIKRTRGCVETAASLVLCAGIEPELLGDIGRLIPSLHQAMATKGHYYTTSGSDGLFGTRINCLSLVIASRGMTNHDGIKLDARAAIDSLSRLRMEDDGEQTNNGDGDGDENALRNARKIDNDFETAKQFCLFGLRGAFRPTKVGVTK